MSEDIRNSTSSVVVAVIPENSHRELRARVDGVAGKVALERWTRADEAGRMRPAAVFLIRLAQLDNVIGALIDARNVLRGRQ